MMALTLGTLILKSLIFEPIALWPLAFFCLSPWVVLIGTYPLAPRVYLTSGALGLAFYLINMHWLYPATGWGYLALSCYQAGFWPMVALPLRSAIRRHRIPLAFALPVVWVGGEMVRAVAFSGFPWFFLSHSLAGVPLLIQISDLTGAYGVSFLVAAVNGMLADFWMTTRPVTHPSPNGSADALDPPINRPPRVAWTGAGFTIVLLLGTLGYGVRRLNGDEATPGPRVAVLQGDFVNTVRGDDVPDREKRRIYFEMIEAAGRENPDLILLPETPWIMYLNPEARAFWKGYGESFEALDSYAKRFGAVLVIGSASLELRPHDLLARERRYNSATIFYPDDTPPDRYDKNHLVYFGEVVPFRFGRLRPVYFWLNRLMPFSGPDGDLEYSLFPGTEFKRFSFVPRSLSTRRIRFGVPICYEDVMPYISREFAHGGKEGKAVDLLLNISNDGWFGRGFQQPQHLAICVFRAVENRVGMARSVNTGISALIEPTGRVHDIVTGDPQNRWPGRTGYRVAAVGTDPRLTIYSRFGDWFGWGCVAGWLVLVADYWILRVRSRSTGGGDGVQA